MATVLDIELINNVSGAISVGASITDAAGTYGIGRSTLYRWIKLGGEAAQLRDEGYDDYDPLLLRLHEEVERATHEAKVEALMAFRKGFRGWDEVEESTTTTTTTITQQDGSEATKSVTVAGRKTRSHFDWQAALAYLERKHPQEWARIIRQEISGPEGGPIPVEQRAIQLAAEIEEFLAAADRSDAEG